MAASKLLSLRNRVFKFMAIWAVRQLPSFSDTACTNMTALCIAHCGLNVGVEKQRNMPFHVDQYSCVPHSVIAFGESV